MRRSLVPSCDLFAKSVGMGRTRPAIVQNDGMTPVNRTSRHLLFGLMQWMDDLCIFLLPVNVKHVKGYRGTSLKNRRVSGSRHGNARVLQRTKDSIQATIDVLDEFRTLLLARCASTLRMDGNPIHGRVVKEVRDMSMNGGKY